MAAASATRILADIGVALASFVSTLATARFLGADGRGELAVVIGIVSVAYLLGNGGLAFSKTFFLATGEIPHAQLLGNAIVAGIALGGSTAIATSLVIGQFPGLARGISQTSLNVGLVFLPISFVELYISFLIIGHQRLFASNVLMLVARMLAATILVIGVYMRPNVTLAVLLLQSYTCTRLVLNVWYLRRADLLVMPKPNFAAFRREIAFGTRARGNDILQHLNMRFDTLILNAFVGRELVGVYSVAIAISEVIWFPSTGIGWVLFPKTSASDDAISASEQAAMASRVSLFVTACFGMLVVGLSFLSLPYIFGSDYSDARYMIALIVSGGIIFSMSIVLAGALAGRGIPEYSSLIAGAGFITMVALDLLLIPRFGAMGAALASAISYASTGVLAAYIYARKTEAGFAECILLRKSDLTALGMRVAKLRAT